MHVMLQCRLLCVCLFAGPGTGKENSRPTSANTVLVVDLAAARRAHEAAAADALEHAQQCLKIDDVMEQVELAKQQLLVRVPVGQVADWHTASAWGL